MPGGISGLYPDLAIKRRKEAEEKFERAKAEYHGAKLMLKEAKRVERISRRKHGKD